MQFFFNQAGFAPGAHKRVLMTGVPEGTEHALLRGTDGRSVQVPVTRLPGETWGDIVYAADLSAITEPGVYRLCCAGAESDAITIAEDPSRDCFVSLCDMFYLMRCGCDLPKEKAGVFAHAACHTGLATVWGTDETHDVRGGWHDAGDYGRYIVPAAKAVADLMMAVQACPEAFTGLRLTEIREEILWELQWMLKMQRADGGVWHKVSCARFCGMIMPDEETEPLYLSPVSTTATGDFCAAMAMAAGFYAKSHPDIAEQMRDAALRAWDFLEHNDPILFTNPEGITTGGYGDRSDRDERFWAVAQLAVLTGEAQYLHAAEEALSGEEPRFALGWGDMTGYALIACMQLPSLRTQAEAVLRARAEGILQRAEKNAYGIAMHDMLPWGSNMVTANDGVTLLLCAKISNAETAQRMTDAAARMLDYLLGCNPTGYSFVTGCGSKPAAHPHHRPSAAAGQAMPGMLVGGPCGHRADACLRAAVPEGTPAGKCYVDQMPSYSGNEVCIYWNSPLVWMMSLLYAAGRLKG